VAIKVVLVDSPSWPVCCHCKTAFEKLAKTGPKETHDPILKSKCAWSDPSGMYIHAEHVGLYTLVPPNNSAIITDLPVHLPYLVQASFASFLVILLCLPQPLL
jgi:hypothetical protein